MSENGRVAVSQIEIGDRPVGPGHRAFLIAEVAQSHDGSLGQAHAFIEAAVEAGADAIKFQTHIADAESTPQEPFRVPLLGKQDATRFEYWKRMEFTSEQWANLCVHARERGLVFLSTPFSLEAVALLTKLDVQAWKIGSGEVNNLDLLDACATTGRPVLLSSGMSGWQELDAAVRRVQDAGAPVAVFQCSSRYPTALKDVGLNVIDELRTRYGTPVGLSDHSGTPFPALAAVARGADVVELHVTFHRRMFGPDVPASVTFEEFDFIAQARTAFAVMDAWAVSKDQAAHDLRQLRALFNKSLALRMPLDAGTELTASVLTAKKPGSGIPVGEKNKVVGRRLARAVPTDRVLTWEDIEGGGDPVLAE